jgi:RHS repeat-associated protein
MGIGCVFDRQRGTVRHHDRLVFNGDTLVATIDQETASGNATGTPATHYIHPDHLGSTNVVTNASGAVEQTLDYFPYGGTRISTGQNPTSRQYIGQFADQSTSDYLNARYYEGSRGQFLTQDSTFLALGDLQKLGQLTRESQQTFLRDPQQMNSYSYSTDNPITKIDPDGDQAVEAYKMIYEGLEWTNRGLYARDISGYAWNGMPSDQTAEIEFSDVTFVSGLIAQYGPNMLIGAGEVTFAPGAGPRRGWASWTKLRLLSHNL